MQVPGWYLPGWTVMVTEFRGMALNCLFCADVLRPLDLAPLTDSTYKYQPGCRDSHSTATRPRYDHSTTYVTIV